MKYGFKFGANREKSRAKREELADGKKNKTIMNGHWSVYGSGEGFGLEQVLVLKPNS